MLQFRLLAVLLICIHFAADVAQAQFYSFDWAKTIDNNTTFVDHAEDLRIDKYGNMYILGIFRGTVDFDPGPGVKNITSTGVDAFLLKLDSNGGFLWANALVPSQVYYFIDLETDNDGNVLVSGRYSGIVDFDPDTSIARYDTSNGLSDIFIQKFDSSGKLLWFRTIGGTSTDEANGIKTDQFGNVFVTGSFRRTVDFDPGPGVYNITPKRHGGMFVLKLNSSGSFKWVKSMEGIPRDLILDQQNNIYIGGHFGDTTDFSPDTNIIKYQISNGIIDCFVLKLDSNGNYIWSRSFGGSGDDRLFSLALGLDNEILSTGWYSSTVDFDPDTSNTLNKTSNGNEDCFVHKLDSNGNFIWVRTFGGANDEWPRNIHTDQFGSVYSCGGFSGNVDFDPTSGTFIRSGGSINDRDIYVQKLGRHGNFVFAYTMGNIYEDRGRSITTDRSGNIICVGEYRWNVDFDPTSGTSILPGTPLNTNLFIQKMGQNPCSHFDTTHVITACDQFTWVNGNTYTSSTFGEVYALTNNTGCDSVMYLDLTINSSDETVDSVTACKYFRWIDGNTYDSSDYTATHILTNNLNCDSSIYLKLTIINADTDVQLNGQTMVATANNATFQWYNCSTGNIIPGETSANFTPPDKSDYAVIVDQNGCTDTSACQSVNSIGIKENSNENSLAIFPNPNNGSFTVNFVEEAIQEIRILSLEGKTIFLQRGLSTSTFLINLDLKKGLYFIEVTSPKGSYQSKFLVN